MKNVKNLFFALGLTGLNLFSGFSQNVVEGCDYLRRLKVNRESNNKKEILVETNFPKYNNFTGPFEGESKNSLEGKVMNVYFQNDNCDLSENDKIDLRRYVLKVLLPYYGKMGFEKLESLNFRGFADCNGSAIYNYHLSHKRAENVARYVGQMVRNAISPSVKIYISAFGEDQSVQTDDSLKLQKDRVVKIISNENPLENAINLCDADIILADQSGSMAPKMTPYSHSTYDWWGLLQNYSFPDSVEVLFFSEFILPEGLKKEECDPKRFPGMFHTYDINTEIATGATCYYPAKNKLFDLPFIKKGDVITTIINGKNDFKGENPDEIIRKANYKAIKSNMIGIDLSGEYVKDFIRIAKETGGRYYFINAFSK